MTSNGSSYPSSSSSSAKSTSSLPNTGSSTGRSPDLWSSPRTSSPLNPYSRSRSPSPSPTPPPSRTSLLPTPPLVERVRLHSYAERDPSPVRNGLIPMTRVSSAPAAPRPRAAASNSPLPAIVLDDSGITSSLFRSRSPARALSPERGHESESESSAVSVSTWWSHRVHAPRPWSGPSKRRDSVPPVQVEGYLHTRSRAIEAIASVLGTAAQIGHEALFTGVDLLNFVPVPGLAVAGRTLLSIWDAVGMVEMNRLASLRLTERCADTLISVREEIADAGYAIAEELHAPIAKLNEAFTEVLYVLTKLGHRPFLKRYLKRDEISSSISSCDTILNEALGMFGLSIQIRTLKIIQANEQRRQKDTQDLLESLSSLPGLPPPPLPFPNASPPADPQSVQKILSSLKAAQDAQDRAHDSADLRQLMHTALAANDDSTMIEVLQIARSEMPEAIKTLQRALERVVEDERVEADDGTISPQQHRFGEEQLADSGSGGATGADTLDREFIETGIDALRRLSSGAELGLPSWTITRYEVDLEAKIGVGFFSDVYRGTWRQHTVAIKVLAETTPRKIFVHEVEIWKRFYHPNVLELLGASSATGDPPWFLVSKYYPRGSLVKYLKGLSDAEAARVDSLRMAHEISKGMAYLHKEGVLHGDLKAVNVLVDDDTRCVISDFGQSEMKSEVYRISRTPIPHGTLRWQAPELMQGAQALTPEMDVYAFAICCVEILTKGALPWPLMDDAAVRYFVLTENTRPSLPPSYLTTGPLMDIIRSSWDSLPSNRPSFERIAHDIKKLRAERSAQGLGTSSSDSPKPGPLLVQWEAQNPYHPRHSPDILPQPLPVVGLPAGSQDSTYHINTSFDVGHLGSALGLDIGNNDVGMILNTPTESDPADSPVLRPVRSDPMLSGTLSSSIGTLNQSVLAPGYPSFPDPDTGAAQCQDERRYRMLLQHDYHTILTLPLWRPSHVELGAVGFLSKPDGRFVTLFNAFNPGETSAGKADELPMLSGYGKVLQGNHRQDKRNAAQRGLDRFQGIFTSARTISRSHSFQLRAGHKVAYLYTETTMYRYITNLDVPKKWFQSNIDHIMKIYGQERRLTREDIYLVIGALDAPDYASFVSHSHPSGQVNFNVFAAPRAGSPWGQFTLTSAEQAMEPSSETVKQDMVGAVTANSVSLAKSSSEPWDSVLLARLRFKPDTPEPTSL